MKHQVSTALAAVLAVASAAILAAQQSAVKPPSTGIPECDECAAMVRACLPRMCAEERLLTEMQLGFTLEVIPKQVELKGRQAAAQTCTADIRKATENDAYGCFASKTGGITAPRPVQLASIRPSATGVSLTLSRKTLATAAVTEVAILTSMGEPPIAVYRLPEWNGQFVLDTASATPTDAKSTTRKPPIQLEPQTTYCFVIEGSMDRQNDVYRKGIFTTLPKR
jgi:hypothetical protein